VGIWLSLKCGFDCIYDSICPGFKGILQQVRSIIEEDPPLGKVERTKKLDDLVRPTRQCLLKNGKQFQDIRKISLPTP